MRIIDNKFHGIIDYATVVGFALVPMIFGLKDLPALLSYSLAGVHLTMTLLTRFELGVFKALPIRMHKIIEMAVGPVVFVSPWLLSFAESPKERLIFWVAGGLITLVNLLSQYKETAPQT